jgi:hypothetical protein
MLGRVVPDGLVADVAREVARRVHGRVEQHRAAARHARDVGGIEAAQRRADHGHRLARPVRDALHHHVDGVVRRRRQLRAPPLQVRMRLRHALRHEPRLGRTGRGAEAVQVQQVGGLRVHGGKGGEVRTPHLAGASAVILHEVGTRKTACGIQKPCGEGFLGKAITHNDLHRMNSPRRPGPCDRPPGRSSKVFMGCSSLPPSHARR